MQYAAEDIAKLWFIVNQPQQRFAARAPRADAQDVFRRRIQANDKQVRVEQDDARTQVTENLSRVVVKKSAIARVSGRRIVL